MHESDPNPYDDAYDPAAVRSQRMERRRREQRRRWRRLLVVCTLVAAVPLLIYGLWRTGRNGPAPVASSGGPSAIAIPEWIDQQIIDLDGAARTGTPIGRIRDIAIHYVANPGTTARQNRNYFNQKGVEVSSHFIVGLEGEVVQCVPLDEKSSATNDRNIDTISIEVCHPDETGRFNDAAYASLVKLCTWLMGQYGLDETHLIRHYDVTGKLCPLYFVRHEDAWERFKQDVVSYQKNGTYNENRL